MAVAGACATLEIMIRLESAAVQLLSRQQTITESPSLQWLATADRRTKQIATSVNIKDY